MNKLVQVTVNIITRVVDIDDETQMENCILTSSVQRSIRRVGGFNKDCCSSVVRRGSNGWMSGSERLASPIPTLQDSQRRNSCVQSLVSWQANKIAAGSRGLNILTLITKIHGIHGVCFSCSLAFLVQVVFGNSGDVLRIAEVSSCCRGL